MAELAQTVTPQGLLAVCAFIDIALAKALAPAPRLVTVLARVRDPGNAGTVLRTADAAGSDLVIFTDASVDPYNGKCVRASAGSVFHVPIVMGPRFDALIGALKAAGLTVVATDGTAERPLDAAIDDGTLARPTAWVFGNEAWGLPDDVLRQVDEVLRVPIYGRAESLNLATAAAVCLYSSARAQRHSG
jgi:TrmH family RNA methyltransferase